MHFIILLIAATVLFVYPVVGPTTRGGKNVTASIRAMNAGSDKALNNMYDYIKTKIFGLQDVSNELAIHQFLEFVGDSNTAAVESYLSRTDQKYITKVNIGLFKILMPELNKTSLNPQANALVFTMMQIQDLRRRTGYDDDGNIRDAIRNSPANSSNNAVTTI
ncbi:uncharacterized protein LOC126835536 [Adelges cooleyi]|uniref:uncharacterized protein LOC126835536 n=1 Tax=Adelges cooleyi TaxID=133065 RepID=UPI0021808AEB|nr:uncharacterized protein LOC126835536 [Adelges cooleyi]